MPPLPRSPFVEVRAVRNGLGLVARRPFSADDLICRLRGRVVPAARLWAWWDSDPRRAANCIRFDEDRYLDPDRELGAYANHSCAPNAVLVKSRIGLAFRAIRVIRAGDEITHDYSTFVGMDDVWRMRCNCGARSCRRIVGNVSSIPAARLRRYRLRGGVPGFIDAGLRESLE